MEYYHDRKMFSQVLAAADGTNDEVRAKGEKCQSHQDGDTRNENEVRLVYDTSIRRLIYNRLSDEEIIRDGNGRTVCWISYLRQGSPCFSGTA